MENENRSIWDNPRLIGFFFILISITLPLIIDHLIFANSFPSYITNGEWASFLGSYIGGLCTMAAVFININDSNKKLKKQKEEQEQKEIENKKMRIRPYLDTRCTSFNESIEIGPNDRLVIINGEKTNGVTYSINNTQIDEIKETLNKGDPGIFFVNYLIHNVGAGSAVDMTVSINDYEEKMAIAKDEIAKLFFWVVAEDKTDFYLRINMKYGDVEGFAKYEKNESIHFYENSQQNIIYSFERNTQKEIIN